MQQRWLVVHDQAKQKKRSVQYSNQLIRPRSTTEEAEEANAFYQHHERFQDRANNVVYKLPKYERL